MGRRAKGEGTIRQRRDGRWEGRIQVGYDRQGKKAYKHVYGRTKREVAKKLAELQQQMAAGVNLAAEQHTVATFLARWLSDQIEPNCRPKTYESYASMARLWIVPSLGGLPLASLTGQHIQHWLNELQKTDLSVTTVRYAHRLLKQALTVAVQWRLISSNPCTGIRLPKPQKYVIQPLSLEQARALLDVASTHRLSALYYLALSLGLRRGELLNLHWTDIDWQEQTVTIHGGKTEASNSTLHLPDTLVKRLQQHQTNQQEEFAALEKPWSPDELVFTSVVGTPISPRNLVRHFKSMLRRTGLPRKIRVHDLRHSCATFLIAQDVHPKAIQHILRHQDFRFTMSVYGHILEETEIEVLDGLGGLLGFAEGVTDWEDTEEWEEAEDDASEEWEDAEDDEETGPDSGID